MHSYYHHSILLYILRKYVPLVDTTHNKVIAELHVPGWDLVIPNIYLQGSSYSHGQGLRIYHTGFLPLPLQGSTSNSPGEYPLMWVMVSLWESHHKLIIVWEYLEGGCACSDSGALPWFGFSFCLMSPRRFLPSGIHTSFRRSSPFHWLPSPLGESIPPIPNLSRR